MLTVYPLVFPDSCIFRHRGYNTIVRGWKCPDSNFSWQIVSEDVMLAPQYGMNRMVDHPWMDIF